MRRQSVLACVSAAVLVAGSSGALAKGPGGGGGNTKSTIGFTSATQTVTEDSAGFAGNTARILLSRTGDTTTVQSVSCNRATSPGTATVGADYAATNPWTATFGAGAKSAYCEIPIVADGVDEVTETIKLVLEGTNLAPTKSTSVLNILDDDAAGSISSYADFGWNEECVGCIPAGSAFVYPVTLNDGGSHAATASVNYAFTDGTATGGASCVAGVDYVNTGGTLTFPVGVTVKNIVVTICNDALDELNETFTSTLSAPVNATIGDATTVVTIEDSDLAGALASYADFAWNEECVGCSDAGAYSFPVTLTGDAAHANPVTVDYALSDGTATGGAACGPGVDYVNTGGTLTFAPGVTSRNIIVPICDDALDEADETFTSTLSNPANATVGDATTEMTIQDSDLAGVLDSYADFSWNEECVGCSDAGAYTFPVTLTGDAAHANPVTVDYALTDGTATGGAACGPGVDYVNTGGTLTFAAGVTSQNIIVPICDDFDAEGAENFTSTLSNASNATIGDATTLVGIDASD